MGIIENYNKIKNEIPDYVSIVPACKTRTSEEVKQLIEAGVKVLAHNYVQEFELMYKELEEYKDKVEWHMIGHLQKNKINKILPISSTIQTVDSYKTAENIDKRLENFNKQIKVLLEINIGEEENKNGFIPKIKTIEEEILKISKLKNIVIDGLMTMGPVVDNVEELRPYFKKTKEIFEELKSKNIDNVNMNVLSMGMSDSYKIAIEEGSNMIRLGTILFGPRVYK